MKENIRDRQNVCLHESVYVCVFVYVGVCI